MYDTHWQSFITFWTDTKVGRLILAYFIGSWLVFGAYLVGLIPSDHGAVGVIVGAIVGAGMGASLWNVPYVWWISGRWVK